MQVKKAAAPIWITQYCIMHPASRLKALNGPLQRSSQSLMQLVTPSVPCAGMHFNTSHMETMGAALTASLIDYWDPDRHAINDLLLLLDYMHPIAGERPRLTNIFGGAGEEQDDDMACTDSDDSDSDEESRARQRTANAAVAAMRSNAQLGQQLQNEPVAQQSGARPSNSYSYNPMEPTGMLMSARRTGPGSAQSPAKARLSKKELTK